MTEPGREELEQAATVLRNGGVVALPTDTVYGIGVLATTVGAGQLLAALKGRPEALAIAVLVAGLEEARRLAVFDPAADALARQFWPGGLTLVLRRRPAASFDLGGDGATIGLRHPADPVALALCRAVGPLAVTSANRHGEGPCRSADEVRSGFPGLAAVLDGGRRDGVASTVVALDGAEPRCVREGAVDYRQVLDVLRKSPSC